MSSLGHRNASAAADWAAKRQAALERAKKLREERRRGAPGEDHTFRPQTNPRRPPSSGSREEPSFPFDPSPHASSALRESPPDIPVAGRRQASAGPRRGPAVGGPGVAVAGRRAGASSAGPVRGGTRPSGVEVAPRPRGGSAVDFFSPDRYIAEGGVGTEVVGGVGAPDPAQAEADDAFRSLLRSDSPPGGAKGRRPAWNDNLENGGGIPSAAPPVPSRGRRIRGRGRPEWQSVSEDVGAAPSQSGVRGRGRGRGRGRPEWQGVTVEDDGAAAAPKSSSIVGRGRPEWQGVAVEDDSVPSQRGGRGGRERALSNGQVAAHGRRAGTREIRPFEDGTYGEFDPPGYREMIRFVGPESASVVPSESVPVQEIEADDFGDDFVQEGVRVVGHASHVRSKPPARRRSRPAWNGNAELQDLDEEDDAVVEKERQPWLDDGGQFSGGGGGQFSGGGGGQFSGGGGQFSGGGGGQFSDGGGQFSGGGRPKQQRPSPEKYTDPRQQRPPPEKYADPRQQRASPEKQAPPLESSTVPVDAPLRAKGSYDFESSSGAYPDGVPPPEAAEVDVASSSEPLYPCPKCGRKMRQAALEKHAKVCDKVFQKARRKFNSAQQRLDLEGADPSLVKPVKPARSRGGTRRPAPSGRGGGRGAPGSAKSKEWKAKSEELRAAMRAARQISKAQKEGKDIRELNLPDIPSSSQSNLVPCPHCGRTFNPQAAERHIPKCATTRAKPTFLKRGTGGGMSKGRRR